MRRRLFMIKSNAHPIPQCVSLEDWVDRMMSLTSLHRVFAPNGICMPRWIQSVDRRVVLHDPDVILDWVDSDADKRMLPSSDTSPSFRMGSVRK
jgi:hypothetical protein